MTELLTAENLARRLGVSPRTIKEWARVKRIPQLVFSPKVRRFDYADVLKWLREPQSRREVSHAH
jgi:excisionase family DNA binding protein